MPPQNDKLPKNFEAEQAVLSCMLRKNECIKEVCGILRGSFAFFTPSHQVLFDLIERAYRKGPIDLVILGEAVIQSGKKGELPNGLAYLALLWDLPCTANPASYAAIVRDKYLRRRAIHLASEFLRNVETGRPIGELLFRLMELVKNLWNESKTLKQGTQHETRNSAEPRQSRVTSPGAAAGRDAAAGAAGGAAQGKENPGPQAGVKP